jgi:hypothetical protein
MTQSTHTTAPRPSLSSWALALQFARREIRGSIGRFRVFLGALLLGVAAIGTVGSGCRVDAQWHWRQCPHPAWGRY